MVSHVSLPIAPIILPAGINPANLDQKYLAELGKNIDEIGQLQPISVWRGKDGLDTLIAGLHRLIAMKGLGKTHINAMVRDEPLSETEVEIEQFSENHYRRKMPKREEAERVFALLKKIGTQAAAAKRLGMSPEEICRLLKFRQFQTGLQELVNDARLCISGALKIALLPDLALQLEIANKAVAEGWKRERIIKEVDKLLGSKKVRKVRVIRIIFRGITLLIPVTGEEDLNAMITMLQDALKVKAKQGLQFTTLPDLMNRP